MSSELRDLRAKITIETDCVLEAMNRQTGKDKSEIVRGILHDWAVGHIGMARILDKLLISEGIAGTAGDRRSATTKAR